MSPTLRLVSAGAATVAVSFGLARYGYGLLLPDLRAALDLDGSWLAVVPSAVLFVAAYNVVIAVEVIWSARCSPPVLRPGSRR